jgi:hypothetical protein
MHMQRFVDNCLSKVRIWISRGIYRGVLLCSILVISSFSVLNVRPIIIQNKFIQVLYIIATFKCRTVWNMVGYQCRYIIENEKKWLKVRIWISRGIYRGVLLCSILVISSFSVLIVVEWLTLSE